MSTQPELRSDLFRSVSPRAATAGDLLFLVFALVANVLLGPLGSSFIRWRVSPNGLNQTYGADAASLLLVVPVALAAAWLWGRHYRLAAPLAMGVGLASLYYAIAEVLGGDYLRYPGNNERFFLLFLAIIVSSWTTAVCGWNALDNAPPPLPRWLARSFGVVLVLAGGLIGLAWTAQLVPIAVTGAVAAEYLDSPSAFWTIRIVDLGFIVPLALWTGIGLWRGSTGATRAAYALASFLTLQRTSVLAMGVIMLALALVLLLAVVLATSALRPGSPLDPDAWPPLLQLTANLGLYGSVVFAQVYRYRMVSSEVQGQRGRPPAAAPLRST